MVAILRVLYLTKRYLLKGQRITPQSIVAEILLKQNWKTIYFWEVKKYIRIGITLFIIKIKIIKRTLFIILEDNKLLSL